MSETRSMEEIREALVRINRYGNSGKSNHDAHHILSAALDELEGLRVKLSESKTTCAYCLATHDAPCPPEAIREHIEVCPKHPLALARSSLVTVSQERDRLREALEATVEHVKTPGPKRDSGWHAKGQWIHERSLAALAPSPTETPATRPAESEAKGSQAEEASGDSPTSGPASPTEGPREEPEEEEECNCLYDTNRDCPKHTAFNLPRRKADPTPPPGLTPDGRRFYEALREKHDLPVFEARPPPMENVPLRAISPTPPPEKTPEDSWSEDRPTDLDEAIRAAHPTKTKRHKEYARAVELVGAKHSKYALVDLVNYLLVNAAPPEKTYTLAEIERQWVVSAAEFWRVHDPGDKLQALATGRALAALWRHFRAALSTPSETAPKETA